MISVDETKDRVSAIRDRLKSMVKITNCMDRVCSKAFSDEYDPEAGASFIVETNNLLNQLEAEMDGVKKRVSTLCADFKG